jgi:hypothetical protein
MKYSVSLHGKANCKWAKTNIKVRHHEHIKLFSQKKRTYKTLIIKHETKTTPWKSYSKGNYTSTA